MTLFNEIISILKGNAVLICTAIFFILMVYIGYKKGLMIKLLSLCSVVVTLVLTLKIYSYMLDFINESEIAEGFLRGIGMRLIRGATMTETSDIGGTGIDTASGTFYILQSYTLPESPLYDLLGLDKLTEDAVSMAADIMGRAICFILVFILIRIAIKMLTVIVRGLKKIKIIAWLDEFFGAAFGFAEGLIYVWLFMFIVSAFPGYEFTSFVLGQISADPVLLYIYNSNIIFSIFVNLLAG